MSEAGCYMKSSWKDNLGQKLTQTVKKLTAKLVSQHGATFPLKHEPNQPSKQKGPLKLSGPKTKLDCVHTGVVNIVRKSDRKPVPRVRWCQTGWGNDRWQQIKSKASTTFSEEVEMCYLEM